MSESGILGELLRFRIAQCDALEQEVETWKRRYAQLEEELAQEKAEYTGLFKIAMSAEREHMDELKDVRARGWDEGVSTALEHAILNPDKITLRLEHLDGRPWLNPYREASA